MMSISPSVGQLLPPSIQNAGQRPEPLGTWMRASTWPYCWVNLPAVWIRPEVNWQVPFQQSLCPPLPLRAVMTRWPWPSMATLLVPLV